MQVEEERRTGDDRDERDGEHAEKVNIYPEPRDSQPELGSDKTQTDMPIPIHRYVHGHTPRFGEFRGKKFGRVRYEVASSKRLLHGYFSITFRFLTCVAVALGVGAIFFCLHFDITAKLSVEFIVPAIIFPISFGITFSLTRRERALLDLASLKASAVSIYVSSREWVPPSKRHVFSKRVKLQLEVLLHRIAMHLAHEREDMLEELRVSDAWISSVISRAYQYVRMMINDFERLRVIHDFRQPSTFIGFELVYLLFGPILLAPHFAQVSKEGGIWSGVYSSVFASVLVIGLFHILRDTEDPFDGFGIDDLDIHMIEEAPLHMWKIEAEIPQRGGLSESYDDESEPSSLIRRRSGKGRNSKTKRKGSRRPKRRPSPTFRLDKNSLGESSS